MFKMINTVTSVTNAKHFKYLSICQFEPCLSAAKFFNELRTFFALLRCQHVKYGNDWTNKIGSKGGGNQGKILDMFFQTELPLGSDDDYSDIECVI